MAKKDSERERLMEGIDVKGRGIGYWFKNVFLYHYRVHVIVALCVIIFGSLIIYEFATNEETDYTITIATDKAVTESMLEGLSDIVAETVGDLNGDGNVVVEVINYQISLANISEDQSNYLTALDSLIMGEPNNVLYILSEELVERYGADWFEYYDDYDIITEETEYYNEQNGIESEKSSYLYINDLPVFAGMFGEDDQSHYLCIRGWTISDKENEEYIELYNRTFDVVRAVLSETE